MNKVKTLSILSLILILFNVGLLVFIFTGHRPPHHKNKHHIAHKVKQDLGFDAAQKEAYKTLHIAHKTSIDSINIFYQQKLFQYFDLLKSSTVNNTLKADLLSQLTTLEQQRIDITFQHVQDLKKICTPEQLAQFPEIVDFLKKRLLPSSDNKIKHPPKD